MSEILDRLRLGLGEKYSIEQKLNRGPIVEQYLAREARSGQSVVVRVFRPNLTKHIGRDRFLEVMASAIRLQRPHILAPIDFGEHNDLLFTVFPQIRGGSLRDHLDARGALSDTETLAIIRGIVEALRYGHEHGLLHLNLNPDDIVFTGTRSLVTDIGIFPMLYEAGTAQRREMLTAQTRAYKAPELLHGGDALDARTDIYAVGAVGYELFTGRPPKDAGPSGTAAVSAGRPLPRRLGRVIMRCLAEQPDDRFQTAADLLSHLISDDGDRDETSTTAAPASVRTLRPAKDTPTPVIAKRKRERPAPPSLHSVLKEPKRRRRHRSPGISSVRDSALNRKVRTQRKQRGLSIPMVATAAALIAVAATGGATLVGLNREPVLVGNRIVVAPFEDHSSVALGSITTSWVTEGLRRLVDAEVVPVMIATARLGDSNIGTTPTEWIDLASHVSARILVTGRIREQGDSLSFEIDVFDRGKRLTGGKTMTGATPVELAMLAPLIQDVVRVATETLGLPRRQDVLGAERFPSMDAYREYVEGLIRFGDRDYRAAVPHFHRAIALDSALGSAHVMAAVAHLNLRQDREADSIARAITILPPLLSESERHTVQWLLAVLAGDGTQAKRAGDAWAATSSGPITEFLCPECRFPLR